MSRRHTTRALEHDDPVVMAIATAAGAHGVYVRNALAMRDGTGVLFRTDGRDHVLCWFGPRGNLVVIAAAPVDAPTATAVADVVQKQRQPWRIVMGPPAVVDELHARTTGKPLVCREQMYYAGTAADAAPGSLDPATVRSAERADRDMLVQATLLLNQSDLGIDPGTVDRRWLRDTIDERIHEGSTAILGPVGAPQCKLDIGSDGVGGRVIEGVFTFPEFRGRGLATSLVAAVLRDSPGFVCLHVGRDNTRARAAYERAGLQVVDSCRLLLLR